MIIAAAGLGVAACTAPAGEGPNAAGTETTSAGRPSPPSSPAQSGASDVSPGWASPPPVPPAARMYVGAYVGRTSRAAASPQPGEANANLATLEARLGHALTLSNHYFNFDDPQVATTLRDDASAGRIPLLSLRCVGPAPEVLRHQFDTRIAATADRIARAGHPVFVRYFWEMNLPARTGAHETCLGRGLSAADQAKDYVQAWRHIRSIFIARRATNVAWVWCPSVLKRHGDDFSSSFYPGDQYVDWVAADGYDHDNEHAQPPLVRHFQDFFTHWAATGKPEMIAETGAPQPAQQRWLDDAGRQLPSTLPLVRALIYFDDPGQSPDLIRKGLTYALGSAGLTAFVRLANEPGLAYTP